MLYVFQHQTAPNGPNKLPKWELDLGKNKLNTNLRKPNKRGLFGTTLFNCYVILVAIC